MVIGNGLMAKTFSDYNTLKDIVVFASGVSNSTETNDSEFKRELDLLKHTIANYPDSKLIYFSTCSIADNAVKDRPYVLHKLKLENYIENHARNYLIFRISNVVGFQGNEHTIMNYLVDSVRNNKEISLWKYAERNLIDADDVKSIVDDVIDSQLNNCIINVAARQSILVVQIIELIENYLGVKAKVNLIEKGNRLDIDTTKTSIFLDKIEKSKGAGTQYIYNLLKKYY